MSATVVGPVRRYSISFFALSHRGGRDFKWAFHGSSASHDDPVRSHSHWNDDFMLVGITQLVQGSQEIIPSFVWLRRNHHIKDFFRNVLGTLLCSTSNFRESLAEGEVSSSSVCSSSNSNGETSLVESGTQINDNIKHNPRQCDW